MKLKVGSYCRTEGSFSEHRFIVISIDENRMWILWDDRLIEDYDTYRVEQSIIIVE